MFSRQEIAEIKRGTHKIQMQPGAEPKVCKVVKVVGPLVWVLEEGKEGRVRLNKVASRNLVAGKYRP